MQHFLVIAVCSQNAAFLFARCNMPEVYLTPDELSRLIKFSKQSIYNLIHKNTFIQGVHYFKPTKKKILFKASAIREWIEGPSSASDDQSEKHQPSPLPMKSEKLSTMRINI